MKRRELIGWILAFALLTGVFFYRTVLHHSLPVPSDALVGLYHPWRDLFAQEFPRGVPFKNFLITDPVRQQIPWRKLAVDSFQSGVLPGWNPYTFAGTPLDANIQAAAYYPLNILFGVMPFVWAWTTGVMLQPFLAGLFMFLYLRGLKRSRGASVIGALAWSYGGFAVAWLEWNTIVHAALWMPLALLSVDRMTHGGRHNSVRLWTILLAVSLVMTITAGHAQVAAYSIGIICVYSIWRLRAAKHAHVRVLAAAFGIAAAVSSAAWIPVLRFLPQTGRIADATAWKTSGWFMPWQHLVQFVAPDYFGNPATMNYWGSWNYGEFIGYIGVAPLVFALTALFLPGVPMFFTAALVVSLLCMLPNPVSVIPYSLHFPLISVLQPTRLLVVTCYSLSVLAAFGFDAFMERKRRTLPVLIGMGITYAGGWLYASGIPERAVAQRNLILPAALFAAVVLWILTVKHTVKFRYASVTASVLILIVIVDLFRFGWKFLPFTPVSYFFPETSVTRFIAGQKQPFRVMSTDDRIFPPNVSAYYGIESIEGYDPITNARYEQYLAASERGNADTKQPSGFHRIYTAHNVDSPLLPYLNVRYVTALADITRPFLREVMREGDVRVYQYMQELPRVYLAQYVETREKSEDALKLLMQRSPERIAVTEQPVSVLSVPLAGDEGVTITGYSDNTVSFRVSAVNTRIAVLLQTYDSRWKATVDAAPTDVLRVNYLFTGVVVPAGTHTVVLRYR